MKESPSIATRQLQLIIQINFQKAFDRLLYQNLLRKQSYYWISSKALKWLKDRKIRARNRVLLVFKIHVTRGFPTGIWAQFYTCQFTDMSGK